METGEVVALKHIFFQAPQRGQDAAAAAEKRGRELAALQAVSHPNVVQLLEALPLVRRPAYQRMLPPACKRPLRNKRQLHINELVTGSKHFGVAGHAARRTAPGSLAQECMHMLSPTVQRTGASPQLLLLKKQASSPAVAAQGDGQVLAMELCATDLADALAAARARLDEALVKALMAQLLRGLHACHAAGGRQPYTLKP